MTRRNASYIPALSYRWLTPFYDTLFKWFMREDYIKSRLVQRASIHPGQHVLDLGCGTGTLAVMLKRLFPAAQVTGLDADRQVLEIARIKAEHAGADIQFEHGFAYELPFPAASFDVVMSSFMVHHLNSPDKVRAFKEVHRILQPGGWFHILDFGRPINFLTRVQARVLGGFEQADDNFNGRIPAMLMEGGFDAVSEVEHIQSLFGPIWLVEAHKIDGA